ncbi:MAG TPA: hypothetical protein VFR96_14420, partial [Povalibacter sp.]|nr:hypothetical protein [Povalibacter sp.]
MKELLDLLIEYVKGAWRFRRYAVLSAWAVAILGWTALFMLRDVYQAHSRVFVDTKTALKPILKGIAIDQDVNAQLNLVRQSLLSGPQLEPVAIEVGLLDPRVATPQQRLRILDDMRDRIEVGVT